MPWHHRGKLPCECRRCHRRTRSACTRSNVDPRVKTPPDSIVHGVRVMVGCDMNLAVRIALNAMPIILAFAVPAQAQPDAGRIQDLQTRALSSRGMQWRCDVQYQTTCRVGACTSMAPAIWIELDFAQQRYSRCDQRGCTRMEARFSTAGIFTRASGTGFALQVVNDGSQFSDAVDIGLVIVNSFGVCRPQ